MMSTVVFHGHQRRQQTAFLRRRWRIATLYHLCLPAVDCTGSMDANIGVGLKLGYRQMAMEVRKGKSADCNKYKHTLRNESYGLNDRRYI